MEKCLSLTKIIIVMMLIITSNNYLFAQSGQKFATAGNSLNSPDFLGSTNAYPLVFKTNNVERFRLTATGYLGLGITDPTFKLDVNGRFHLTGNSYLDSNLTVLQNISSSTIKITSFANNGNKMVMADNSGMLTTMAFGQPNEVLFGNGNWGLIPSSSLWAQNGSNIYYNHGYLGIGTINPQYDLDIIGDARISNNLYVGGGIVITEKVQANVDVNTAALNADSIIMDSTRAFYGYSNFKGDVRLQNKLDVYGSVGVLGDLKTSGTTKISGNIQIDSLAGVGFQLDSLSANTYKLVYSDQDGNIVSKLGPSCNGGTSLPWMLGGNIITTYTNPYSFIGTCSNFPFRMFTNSSERMRITEDGNVGIGTAIPQYKLDVCGTIRSKEWVVEMFNCPDYVFEPNYKRKSWQEKEIYFNENKHLFGIDPASEVEKNGLQIGKIFKGILLNVEENSLDIVELFKSVEALKKENELLKKEIIELKNK